MKAATDRSFKESGDRNGCKAIFLDRNSQDSAKSQRLFDWKLEASSWSCNRNFSEGHKVMRHQRHTKKLGRNTSHRRALLRNLVTSLIMEERLETTPAKAKAMRPHVEKMITLGKRGDLSARRLAGSYLMTRESVSRLFETVAPRFGDRSGGYLRIIHKGWRQGDGAATCYIELLGSEKVIEAKRAKRAETRTKRQEEVRKQMEEEQATAAAEQGGGEDEKK
jgi:large subunit ribosomal protein L17